MLFKLDINDKSYTQCKDISQFDSRTITIELFQNGQPYSIATKTIKLEAKNSNNNAIIQTDGITKSNNVITVNLKEDITRVSGKVEMKIILTENSKSISTFKFMLNVDSSVTSTANILPAITVDVIEILQNKIDEAVKVKDDTVQAIEDNKVAMEKMIEDNKVSNDKVIADNVITINKITEDNKQLIAQNKVAVKQDIAEINSQLDNKASNVNSLSGEKIIKVQQTEEISDFINKKISEGVRHFIFDKPVTLNKKVVVKGKPFNIIFEGLCGSNQSQAESVLISLNTGDIGFECINNHNIQFKNIVMSSVGCTTPSKIGILASREGVNEDFGSSQSVSVKNVSIRMHDDVNANNGYGTIGLYWNTVEVSAIENINVIANTALVLTKTDIANLCPYNNYKTSLKDININGYCSLMSLGKSSVVVDGVLNLNADNLYVADFKNTGRTDIYGLEFFNYNANIRLMVDCEQLKNTVGIFGRVSESDLQITALRPEHIIVLENKNGTDNPILTASSVKRVVTWEQNNNERVHIVDKGATAGINNCAFFGDFKVLSGSPFVNNLCYGTLDVTKTNSTAKRYIDFRNGTLGIGEFNISDVYGTPPLSDTGRVGDLRVNRNDGSVGNPALFIRKSDGNWSGVGNFGERVIQKNLIATTIPIRKAEIIFDEVNNIYMSYGTQVGQFKQISM